MPGYDDLCWVCGLLYFYLRQLWWPVSGMWIVIFLPMPAVTTCVGYVDCYISTYASCAKFCFSTYSNCARLWQPVLGMWIVIFLPIPAVKTCAGQTEGYIFTYASCAGGASVVFLPMPPGPGMQDCYISTYASCDDLCRVYRGYPCFRLAAIFAGMLYSVQIIQKSSTRNIMHVNIIVIKLPAKLHRVID